MVLAFQLPLRLTPTARPSAFLQSRPSATPSRPTTRPARRHRLTVVAARKDQPDGPSGIGPRLTRRQAVQLLNGVLGAFTLTLLVKMREQFRLISPKAILAALGLGRVPLRTAAAPPVPAAAAATAAGVRQEALDYLRSIEARGPVRPPDFPRGADWINSRPLSLEKELAGKVVLLDFFTYCCINCQHVLPKLQALEDKYGADGTSGFAVVGVHSAKFAAERETRNIAAAVERYGIRHPVINDERMTIWNAVGISSWPTLALVGPKGNVLAVWSGERQEEDIDSLIAASLEYYSDAIDHRPLPSPPAGQDYGKLADSPLRYPGKVTLSADGKRLFVADSGNNRVLEVDEASGKVLRAFGGGEQGLIDAADPAKARFHTPQGMAEHAGVLYVADTEAHAVRAIDLSSGAVITVGGNGEQGFDYSGGKAGKEQQLSSPWDVEVVDDALYVAMAGTHQIWRMPGANKGFKALNKQQWEVFSGSGRELEKNSKDGRIAAWAQPSHLSLGSNGLMYVADSESSTLRSIDMRESRHPTKTIAGGDGLLEENLFAFGDKEGRGARAKFQHPLAVCSDSESERVFVADSYNHRIKVVDDTGYARTFCGTGKPGLKDGGAQDAMFWEPAGLALSADGKKLYVSDTNNFAIRVIDTNSKVVRTIALTSSASVTASADTKPLVPYRRRAVFVDGETVKPSSKVNFSISLPEKSHFTNGTTSRFQVNIKSATGGEVQDSVEKLGSGTISQANGSGSFNVDLSKYSGNLGNASAVEVETVTYYCTEVDDVCRTELGIYSIPLSGTGASSSTINHSIIPRRAGVTGGTTPSFGKTV